MQQDLFGKEVIPPRGQGYKGRIAQFQYSQLIGIYGTTAGKKCKDCLHCIATHPGSRKFYKCELAKVSHSPATDWNSRWNACGKFEPQ